MSIDRVYCYETNLYSRSRNKNLGSRVLFLKERNGDYYVHKSYRDLNIDLKNDGFEEGLIYSVVKNAGTKIPFLYFTIDFKSDTIQGFESAKTDGEVLDLEKRHAINILISFIPTAVMCRGIRP